MLSLTSGLCCTSFQNGSGVQAPSKARLRAKSAAHKPPPRGRFKHDPIAKNYLALVLWSTASIWQQLIPTVNETLEQRRRSELASHWGRRVASVFCLKRSHRKHRQGIKESCPEMGTTSVGIRPRVAINYKSIVI